MLLLKLILVLTLVANAQGLQLPDFKLPTIDFGASSVPKITPPSNFLPPPRAPLSIKSSRQLPGLLTGCTALGVRLGSSAFVLGWTPNISTSSPTEGYSLTLGPLSISDSSTVLPTAEARGIREPLVLYEYECSPYCRKVREVLNILDIPVLMKPCPIKKTPPPPPSSSGGSVPYVKKERAGFSDELFFKTNRRTVPYLEDPNNPQMSGMFESEDIIDYLLETYSPQGSYDPKALWPMRGTFADSTSTFATIFRSLAGANLYPTARPDNTAMKPITLYGYECSPFVKPVRERLCELGLPHVVVPCSRGSENRAKLQELTGEQFQVPQIDDPNTGVGIFAESESIVDYLTETYTI